MTAPAFPDGIDAAVWEEVDWAELNRRLYGPIGIPDHDRFTREDRYFVRRVPTPTELTMPSECVHCGEPVKLVGDDWTHEHGRYRCQSEGVAYGHLAHPDGFPCRADGPNPCLGAMDEDTTPTMPVLPTEPTMIRATTANRTVDGYWDGRKWVYVGAQASVYGPDITAWEPLLTRSEAAEAFGVEELREAFERQESWSSVEAAIIAFLARVDGAS